VKPVFSWPVPCVVVTETFTLPAACAIVVAVTFVGDVTCTDVAVAGPNVTMVVPVRWVPVMVTFVPPVVDPEVGATEVTIGGGVAAPACSAVNPTATVPTRARAATPAP
jgi:hypothetical protein